MRQIPEHLSHLRRDRRGLPVPYINRWGPEDPARLSIGLDRSIGALAVLQDDSGFDEPDFTAQNFDRQRECMWLGLCQVCARQVPWSRRWLVLADMSIERVRLDNRGGEEVPVVTEPWLCERCMEYAVDICPALIRRRRDEHLVPVSVTSKTEVTMVLSNGWIEGPLEAYSKAVRPVFWAKTRLDRVSITELFP